MYKPVQKSRLFTFDTKYEDVNWNDFKTVVKMFQQQMDYWYILPGHELKNNHHFGFAVATMACILIDSLSQYEDGQTTSSQTTFKKFLKVHWPELGDPFTPTIRAMHNGRRIILENGSDVIYSGLRCGILHEAHIKLYTGLAGLGRIMEYHASGFTQYSDNSNCPTVIIDGFELFNCIEQRFNNYMKELLNRDSRYDILRENFKRKFEDSFGVEIRTIL